MNLRWYVQRAWKGSTKVHEAVNVMCVATWIVSRIVLFPWLICFVMFPRLPAFRATGRLDCFLLTVWAHAMIWLLSVGWLIQLVKTISKGGSKSPNE